MVGCADGIPVFGSLAEGFCDGLLGAAGIFVCVHAQGGPGQVHFRERMPFQPGIEHGIGKRHFARGGRLMQAAEGEPDAGGEEDGEAGSSRDRGPGEGRRFGSGPAASGHELNGAHVFASNLTCANDGLHPPRVPCGFLAVS